MKIIAAVMFALCLTAHGQTNKPIDEIRKVFAIGAKDFKEFLPPGRPPKWRQLSASIDAIDVSKCPKGFQIAWVDLSTSLQCIANDAAMGIDFIALGELLSPAPVLGAIKLADDAQKRNKEQARDANDLLRAVGEIRKELIRYQ